MTREKVTPAQPIEHVIPDTRCLAGHLTRHASPAARIRYPIPARPGHPTVAPAGHPRSCGAGRANGRSRVTELYDQRTRTEAQLKALQAAAPQDNDLSLLDLLPVVAGLFADAPARIREALMAAFDIQILYRSDMHQVTIRAALTDDTPRTITAYLTTPAPTATPPASPQARTRFTIQHPPLWGVR